MADIKHDAVGRRIKHVMECDSCLDDTEIGTNVAAVCAEFADQRCAQFAAQQFKFVKTQFF